DLRQGVPRIVDNRFDLRAEIDGKGDESFLVGLNVEDAGIAGVAGALEHRDRALIEMEAGGVLELEAQQREFGMRRLVVNGDALALDILVDDGQQRRLLARE